MLGLKFGVSSLFWVPIRSLVTFGGSHLELGHLLGFPLQFSHFWGLSTILVVNKDLTQEVRSCVLRGPVFLGSCGSFRESKSNGPELSSFSLQFRVPALEQKQRDS